MPSAPSRCPPRGMRRTSLAVLAALGPPTPLGQTSQRGGHGMTPGDVWRMLYRSANAAQPVLLPKRVTLIRLEVSVEEA